MKANPIDNLLNREGNDFARLLSAVGRLLDETWRVSRQEQTRDDGHIQKRQFELEDRVERLESDDDGSP